MWQPVRGRKQANWSILARDVLPNNVGKNMKLIAQLQALYQETEELSKEKPRQEVEDFSI
jgi:hypothetical protein